MNIFAIMYVFASTTSILAGIPQIVQIIRSKNVEGISLQTYDMWALLQVMSLPYTVQSGNILWSGVSVAWLAYYLVVVFLIERYSYPRYTRYIVSHVARLLSFVPAHARV